MSELAPVVEGMFDDDGSDRRRLRRRASSGTSRWRGHCPWCGTRDRCVGAAVDRRDALGVDRRSRPRRRATTGPCPTASAWSSCRPTGCRWCSRLTEADPDRLGARRRHAVHDGRRDRRRARRPGRSPPSERRDRPRACEIAGTGIHPFGRHGDLSATAMGAVGRAPGARRGRARGRRSRPRSAAPPTAGWRPATGCSASWASPAARSSTSRPAAPRAPRPCRWPPAPSGPASTTRCSCSASRRCPRA